jgi:hypothetical protein
MSNTIKREYTAFSYHAWRSWDNNEPMVSFNVQDAHGNEATQFLTLAQAEEVIVLLENAMAEAKALPEHEPQEPTLWDDNTPF